MGESYSSNNHFRATSLFEVQVNFKIPILEGQIDTNVLDRWLNLLGGYFSVHNFFDREKNTFTLVKVFPHVKEWWENHCEQRDEEESS